jgi:hypothetical protein
MQRPKKLSMPKCVLEIMAHPVRGKTGEALTPGMKYHWERNQPHINHVLIWRTKVDGRAAAAGVLGSALIVDVRLLGYTLWRSFYRFLRDIAQHKKQKEHTAQENVKQEEKGHWGHSLTRPASTLFIRLRISSRHRIPENPDLHTRRRRSISGI